jgi:hypothetical protein
MALLTLVQAAQACALVAVLRWLLLPLLLLCLGWLLLLLLWCEC